MSKEQEGSQRMHCKMAYLLRISSLIVLILLMLYLLKINLSCGGDRVREVCKAYKNNHIDDKFCGALCSNDAIIGKCLSVNLGKTVFELKLGSEKFILKYDNTDSSISGLSDEKNMPNELYILNNFNDSKWSVSFYGSCGGIYAVQPVSNLAGEIFGNADDIDDLLGLPDIFDETFSLRKVDENSSSLLKLSKNFIETFEGFLYDIFFRVYLPSFPQKIEFMKQVFLMMESFLISSGSQLLICDVHMNNFGILDDNSVRIIDADHIFPMAKLTEKFSEMTCSSNDQCRIGDSTDCVGICNQTLHKCASSGVFPNLGNVCKVMRSIVISTISPEELSRISVLYEKINQCETTFSSSHKDELQRVRILLQYFENVNEFLP